MSGLNVLSPKRDKADFVGWEGFFPYYAGYPARFAIEAIRSAGLAPRSSILDPWNGSGTTTFAAAQLGHSAIGFDMNPVMVVIARARMLPSSESDSLIPLSKEIINGARIRRLAENEPLLAWFDENTAGTLRAIESSIQRCLIGVGSRSNLERISSIAATFYAALFALTRDMTTSFQSSNPTWLKTATKQKDIVSSPKENIQNAFLAKISSMSAALAQSAKENVVDVTLAACRIGDSTALSLQKDSIDLVLGSPPYCTRIDYTAATRVELAVLAGLYHVEPRQLGQKMIGSTRVPKLSPDPHPQWGKKCLSFLNDVMHHPSKASSGYYYKSHTDYFDKMFRSISNIATVLRPKAKMVLVVQDSYYKNVHNPLPEILTEMAHVKGLKLTQREDFTVKRSMGSVNSGSRQYRGVKSPIESVLCFEKVSSRPTTVLRTKTDSKF